MNTCYFGIDLGTTALKAAAIRAVDGAVLARASVRLPVRVAPDGTREQDLTLLGEALRAVLAELRVQVGSAASLAGIGLAAQGGSGALVRREDGEPLTPLLLWNDSRHRACAREIEAARPAGYWQALSHTAFPGPGLGRLRWYRATFPELFRPDTMYVGAGEYANFLLTGIWRQDACNALQIGCYHVDENRLEEEPLELAAGVSLAFVAPLRRGHELHTLSAAGARLLDLPEGLPVAGPYMDHEAGYMAARHISSHPLQCSLGTAWVGNFVVPAHTAGGSSIQLLIPAPTARGQLVIQPLLTGNVSWDWALNCFVHEDIAGALSAAERIFQQQLLPPEGMIALPWFTQANPLRPDADGAGTFYGISVHADAPAFLRALAAGLCCEFHRVFAEVAHTGMVDSLVLGGGASKGWYYRQQLAALFHPLPAYTLEDEELAGARGTLYAFDPSLAHTPPLPVPLPPDDIRARIARHYEHYLTVFDRLYGQQSIGGPYRVCPNS